MLRQAFSMIELVFVIVILGILAAVAIPRFASIQDDALIAAEKTTIGVARQGVTALYGKRLIRGVDMNVTLYNKDNEKYGCIVDFSQYYYPISVTVSDNSANVTAENNSSTATSRGDYKALALVVEPESLSDWNSSSVSTSQSTVFYTGQASNTIRDGNAEIHIGNYWEYSNVTGKFTLK